MPRYIAFLRAINVGGHVVTMGALRGLFESAGYENVETFIASGNVIFDARGRGDALEKKIAAALKKGLGYEVATFVRTPEEVRAIAEYEPFPAHTLAAPGSTLHVGFLASALRVAAKKSALALQSKVDSLHLHGREIYWHSRVRFVDAEFTPARFEKALGIQATFRNVNTVRRIAAKHAPAR